MVRVLAVSLLSMLLLSSASGCRTFARPELDEMEEYPFGERLIVAVLDFENESRWKEDDGILDGLGDVMIEELMKWGRLRVVEKRRIEDVLAQLARERSDLFSADSINRLGKLLGVDALLFSVMTNVAHKETTNHGGLAYNRERRTEVTLSSRLVRVETGEVLCSSKYTSWIEHSESVALGFARSGSIPDEATSVRAALGIAIPKVANEIAARVMRKGQL